MPRLIITPRHLHFISLDDAVLICPSIPSLPVSYVRRRPLATCMDCTWVRSEPISDYSVQSQLCAVHSITCPNSSCSIRCAALQSIRYRGDQQPIPTSFPRQHGLREHVRRTRVRMSYLQCWERESFKWRGIGTKPKAEKPRIVCTYLHGAVSVKSEFCAQIQISKQRLSAERVASD